MAPLLRGLDSKANPPPGNWSSGITNFSDGCGRIRPFMTATTIASIRATPVTVPLEAPLLPAMARTGAASCGPSSRSRLPTASSALGKWVAAARTQPGRSRGSRPTCAATTYSRWKQCASRSATRPPASTTTARNCTPPSNSPALDIMGQKLGVPVHALLGGKAPRRGDFASYLFFRYADPRTGRGEECAPRSNWWLTPRN